MNHLQKKYITGLIRSTCRLLERADATGSLDASREYVSMAYEFSAYAMKALQECDTISDSPSLTCHGKKV